MDAEKPLEPMQESDFIASMVWSKVRVAHWILAELVAHHIYLTEEELELIKLASAATSKANYALYRRVRQRLGRKKLKEFDGKDED